MAKSGRMQQVSEKNYELLIRLDEKQRSFNELMNELRKDIFEMKSDLSSRIAIVENSKVSRDELESRLKSIEEKQRDHETRMRRLEKVGGFAIGGAYVLILLLEILTNVLHVKV